MSALVKLWIAVAVLIGLLVLVFKVNEWTLKGTAKEFLKWFPKFALGVVAVAILMSLSFHFVPSEILFIRKKFPSFDRTIVTMKTLEELRGKDPLKQVLSGKLNDGNLITKLVQYGVLDRPQNTILDRMENFRKQMDESDKKLDAMFKEYNGSGF
jgi:hypothetical protein